MALKNRALTLVVGFSAAVLTACGAGAPETEPTQTETVQSPVETTEPEGQTPTPTRESPTLDEETDGADSDTDLSGGFSVEPQSSADYDGFVLDVSHDTMQVLDEIRVGSHDRYERLVFEYSESTDIAFHAGYSENPKERTDDDLESLGAQALLVVEVLGTTGGEQAEDTAHTDSWTPTTQQAMVREIRPGELDGGESELLIFLDEERPFQIDQATEPNRIIIDIAQ